MREMRKRRIKQDIKTPCFILDQEAIKKNILEFKSTCKTLNYKIFYSVKTNSLDSVLKIMTENNIGLEAASMLELKKALQYTKNIVFNGPCKTTQELKFALKNSILINVDNLSELKLIEKLKSKLKLSKIEIGLRLGFNRFGFDASQLKGAIDKASKFAKVKAVSFHPGTQLSLRGYTQKINQFLSIIKRLNDSINIINIGGGFPDRMQMKNTKTKISDYINKLKSLLKQYNIKKRVWFEPGRFLVADAMNLVTKVHYIKQNNNINYAVCDAGINVLSKSCMATHKIIPIKNRTKKKNRKDYILAGPLLFANDTIGKYHGMLDEGDLIKINNVGAYCYNLAWELSYKKPKVVVS